jgi:hypothetical protein
VLVRRGRANKRVELDSVLVHVTTYEDMRRLTREGAEIWQEWRDGLQWDGALMRVPAAVALRLRLIAPGIPRHMMPDTGGQ